MGGLRILVDDFQDLVGVTPTAYLRQRSDGATHLRLDSSCPTPGRVSRNSVT